MSASVDTPLAAHADMQQRWELPEILWQGLHQLRECGDEYLYKHQSYIPNPKYVELPPAPTGKINKNPEPKFLQIGESNSAWKHRHEKSTLENHYRHVISSIAGRIFAEPVRVSDSSPDIYHQWAEDIDMEGNDLNAFCNDAFTCGVHHGKVHLLADKPTFADQELAQTLGKDLNRPYLSMVKAPQAIGWQFMRLAGAIIPTQFRVASTHQVPDGEYGEKEEETVMVYRPGSSQLHVINGDESGDMEPAPNTWDFIALQTFYTNKIAPFVAYPYFEGLAWLNLAHYNLASMIDFNLNDVLFPVRFISGADGKKDAIAYGNGKILTSTNAQARMNMVESSGVPAEIGSKKLSELVDAMSRQGRDPLLSQRGGSITATEYAIRTNVGESVARSWAVDFKQTMERTMTMMGRIQGIDQPCTIEMNTERGIDFDGREIKDIFEAKDKEIIDAEQAQKLLIGKLFPDDFQPAAPIIVSTQPAEARPAIALPVNDSAAQPEPEPRPILN